MVDGFGLLLGRWLLRAPKLRDGPKAPGLRSDFCEGRGQPAMGQAGVLTSEGPEVQLQLQIVEAGISLGESDQSWRWERTDAAHCC